MLSNGLRIVSTGHGTVFANGLSPTTYLKLLSTDVDWVSKIRTAPLSRNHGEVLHHAKAVSKHSRTKHAGEVIVTPSVLRNRKTIPPNSHF